MESYGQQFRVEADVIHVRLSGTYPIERLAIKANLFEPLIEACKKGNCRLAIVDARELHVAFDTGALFRAGIDAAALQDFGLHVALLAREDMISAFFDDVTHNRGAPVHVFTDVESARAWIDGRRSADLAHRKVAVASRS